MRHFFILSINFSHLCRESKISEQNRRLELVFTFAQHLSGALTFHVAQGIGKPTGADIAPLY
jgi:hypothetical protein